jgi:hypothetical protein
LNIKFSLILYFRHPPPNTMHNIPRPINILLRSLARCCFSNQRARHVVITDGETETDGVLLTFKCTKLTYRDGLTAGSTCEASGHTGIIGNISGIKNGFMERKLSAM